jgi:PPP family 3-phenylpropionic acid transporter
MNKIYLKLSLLYFTYFALLGVMAPYLGLYLDDQAFDLLEISQLLSLLMITKVLAPLLWGTLSDHFSNNVVLVRFGTLMTLVCYSGFFFAESFWEYAVTIILFSFFWNAVLPQIEVVTLYNLGEKKEIYGRIRLWGSVGFIFSVMGFGLFFNEFGISYFPIVLLFIISTIFLSSLFSFEEPDKLLKKNAEQGRFITNFERPDVRSFFVVCFLLQISHGAYYTYFSIYLESLGYSTAEVGALWSLGVIAEVILFIYMHRWLSIHSIKFIMLVSLVFTTLRWTLTALYAENWVLIVFVQGIHALSFGAMHATAIKFVHQNFHHGHQGRAQAMYSVLGFGAGGACGAYVSGLLVSSHDYEGAFLVSALVSLIAIAFVLSMHSSRQSECNT